MATSAARRGPYRDRPQRRAAEPLPVASGRFWIAAALVGAMILIPFSPIGAWFTPKPPEPTDMSGWAVGNTGELRLTLITADSNLLSCSSEQTVDGAHCQYKTETQTWPRDPADPIDDNKKDIVQPYRTWPDNKLILIAGLWAEPNMALRLHREPPSVPAQQLARFVAKCQVKFVGRMDKPLLRWGPGGPWQTEGAAMVARPVQCELGEEEGT